MSSEFSFVLIPSAVDAPLEQCRASKAGGLEADELQLRAKAQFAPREGAPASDESRVQELSAQLQQQGIDPASVDRDLLQAGASRSNEASIEILSLILPSKENDYAGVSMYCDGNGSLNGSRPNDRATRLLQRCGVQNVTVLGDAFVGRCFDNEDFEWERRDLALADVEGDDCWLLRTAARCNRGKNMSQYSTSGQLQKMIAANPGAKAAGAGAGAASSSSTSTAAAAIALAAPVWTQTEDDVELQLVLPAGMRAKDVKLTFARAAFTLKLGLPEGAGAADIRCAGGDGASDPTFMAVRDAALVGRSVSLAAEIDASDSTWCLEQRRGNGDCVLCVTMVKRAQGSTWPALLQQA